MSPLFKSPIDDPSLYPFDGGVGVLTRDGYICGHVATTLSSFSSLFAFRKEWWVWYLVVWSDGTREYSQEDYPPWSAVEEMKSGYFEWDSGDAQRSGRYDFAWLAEVEASAVMARYGITPDQF